MSTLKVTSIQDTAGANSATTEQIYNGIAKAWINFNGTGTVAIRADFNVATLTDNGVGDYTITFSTAMPDANYVAVGMENDKNNAAGAPMHAAFTESTYQFLTGFQSNTTGSLTLSDYIFTTIAIFR